MGKTYIIAGAIDYFAARGGRNFVVIAPNQAILTKTIAQFTAGAPKSLTGGMQTTPVVVTADNFRTPAMRAAMDDPDQVKLYVFSVQALIRPTSEVGRRTHKFQEGLGKAFYQHLVDLPDLIAFADEHHAYFGPAFSKAIRNLDPYALVGLTGTPHPKTPTKDIIFRYPLTAAIGERLVKTPVIVGRRDDLVDQEIQLLDGVQILEAKQAAVDAYVVSSGKPSLNAILLVNARDIAHAEEVGALLRSNSFRGGAYKDKVLVVHSEQADEALKALEGVEDPDSPIRIIVQVGMLKEGWDIKTVFVIASLRASVSEILTEQTMGRGLRLPYGEYTGVEMLDTLDVLAHESYEKVLARADALQEALIDHRTVLSRTEDGSIAITETGVTVGVAAGEEEASGSDDGGASGGGAGESAEPPAGTAGRVLPPPVIRITPVDDRKKEESAAAPVAPSPSAPTLHVPVTETIARPTKFSLRDITDESPYEALGKRLAAMPESSLRRMRIAGQKTGGGEGGVPVEYEVATEASGDVVEAAASSLPFDEAKAAIVVAVRGHRVVPGRGAEGPQALRLVEAVITGAGSEATALITRYPSQVASEIIAQITKDRPSVATPGQEITTVKVEPLTLRPHPGRNTTSANHTKTFSRQTAYSGWKKSIYPEVTFDSDAERRMAVLLDGDAAVTHWLRLVNDLPLLWGAASRSYNPDFLVVTADGRHWIVEVKADKDIGSQDVQDKAQAARVWVNTVNGDAAVSAKWGYLLVSESDLAAAKDSWKAVMSAGSKK